jgi:hypothetical protein
MSQRVWGYTYLLSVRESMVAIKELGWLVMGRHTNEKLIN